MRKLLFLVICSLVVGSTYSAVILNVDDTWIREDSADSNRNGEAFMNVRTDIDADDNDAVLLRFDLTGEPPAASGNSLNITWYRDDGSTGKTLSLYGLLETDPDETTWSESTVTYNTAPGLLPDGDTPTVETGLGNSWDDVRDLDTANLTLLVGSQAYGPQVEGDLYTFSGAALDAFLNADTNGQVTFLILRGDPDTSSNQARFIAREATNFNSGAAVPEGGAGAYLDIPAEPPYICTGVGTLIQEYAEMSCRTDSDYADVPHPDSRKLSIEVDLTNDQSAKSWIRFNINDLGIDPNNIKETTLRLTLIETESQGDTFDVSAVNDDYRDNIEWNDSDLTWNNAPANDTASWEDPDFTKATKMGTVNLGSNYNPGNQHYIDVTEALQGDTDGIVQFILHNSSALIQIGTHDHPDGDEYHPQLNILISPEGADNPYPCPGSTVGTDLPELRWTNPDPNDGSSPITCTVYLGLEPNRPQMDWVTLDPDVHSVLISETNFPNFYDGGLYNNEQYFWYVDCDDPSAGLIPGLPWDFYVNDNAPPVVDVNLVTPVWLGMSGTPGEEVVDLYATVTDDGLPDDPPGSYTLKLLWTQEDNGAPPVVIDPNNVEDISLTFTQRGDYLFTLTADDGQEGGSGISSESVRVVVGDTACDASHIFEGTIADPAPYDPGDQNEDCIVDLFDFAELIAKNWLDCTDDLDNCGN